MKVSGREYELTSTVLAQQKQIAFLQEQIKNYKKVIDFWEKEYEAIVESNVALLDRINSN